MANRALKVSELIALYQAHGCSAGINPNNYVVVKRPTPPFLHWTQHAHKGARDTFDKITVGRSRRKLGFDSMSDEEFYGPLG